MPLLLHLLCEYYGSSTVQLYLKLHTPLMGLCLSLFSRSSNYPFSNSPLYSQTPPTSSSNFYEATSSSESDITGPVGSQPVSVATPGASSGGAAASGAGYMIQGGYGLGGGTGAAGGGQSYSSPNSRAPPATVSIQQVMLCSNKLASN